MILNFFNSIALLSFFLVVVLSSFFFITVKGNRLQNILLSIILLLFSSQIFYSFVVSNPVFMYFMKWHKGIFLVKQFSLLSGPFIYLYIRSYIDKESRLVKKDLLHVIPFLFVILFLIFFYYGKGPFIIWRSKIHLYSTLLAVLSNLVYIVFAAYKFHKLLNSFKNFVRNISNSGFLSWLQFLLLGYISLWVVNLNTFAIVMILEKPGWCAYTRSIYALVTFLFMSALMFTILFKPEIYVKKKKASLLSYDKQNDCLSKLTSYMEKEKPYLDPDISLQDIASALSIDQRELSKIINDSFNCTFKSFISQYRVNECIAQFTNPLNYSKPVKEVMYDAGFVSKSAFNNAFKKQTGLSPVDFRRNISLVQNN